MKNTEEKNKRPKLYGARILVPLPVEMVRAIAAALGPGETRVAFIREAIRRRLTRRA